jgi:hypothetical protein
MIAEVATSSLPLEIRLPLLDVRRETFLRVARLEENVLQLALEGESIAE